MQIPNSQHSSNPTSFPPKLPQFTPMNPFFQFFSLMSGFPAFPFPPTPDMLQMKLMNSMFEKFMQSQTSNPAAGANNQGTAKAPLNLPDLSNSKPALQENPLFMSMMYDSYLKGLRAGPGARADATLGRGPFQLKEEFVTKEEPKNSNAGLIGLAGNSNPTNSHQISNINLSNPNGNSTQTYANPTSQPQPQTQSQPLAPSNEASKTNSGEPIPEDSIRDMLFYFVKHIGTLRRTIIEKDGEKIHQGNQDLKEVFIGLMKKFLSSRKTKEEKIKYVLRKCFKFMKDKLLEENGFTFDSTDDYVEKLNSDKVDKMFFKHYFSEKCGKQKKFLTKNEITFIKDISMPFRKNSQNKTMNIEFLKWIFSNEMFFKDYTLFLKNFNEVTSQDNVEKITKTAKKIYELMETKNYKGFSQKYFKRMPWLDIWRIEAKEIALNLIDVYAKPEERAEILDSDEISLETLEPKAKKIKLDSEVKTPAV